MAEDIVLEPCVFCKRVPPIRAALSDPGLHSDVSSRSALLQTLGHLDHYIQKDTAEMVAAEWNTGIGEVKDILARPDVEKAIHSHEAPWRDEPAPTHRCVACNAMWRYWPQRDTQEPDSWDLCSAKHGSCCEVVAIGKHIVPATNADLEKWIASRTSL